jgi:hypothetical protein
MDAITPKARRNSRWSREPKIENGRALVARITEDDIAAFTLLGRYRYLPIDYIAALDNRKLISLQWRFDLLQRRPNQYVNRPEQQRENADANYRRLIYELDDNGAFELEQRGAPYVKRKYHRNFAHELMVCMIAASFEIGTKENPEVQIIPWRGILASDKLPSRTRHMNEPRAIPFTNQDGEDDVVLADWEPFAIKKPSGFHFLPGFEADCGTEPIDATNDARSSIRAKFTAYLSVMQQETYRSHFGASTFIVPFITNSETRMRSMMALLERMQPGRHGARFIFKHIPGFTAREVPPATGHMLTEPWQRVGQPFSFV